MTLAVGTKWFHRILHLILRIGFHGLSSLHKLFTSLSILVLGLCMLYHNLYCVFSYHLPSISLVSGIYIAVIILTWVVQSLRLALSNGPNRVGVSSEDGNRSSFRNVVLFSEYRTMDNVQKPSNSECYAPSSEPFGIH
jgi:hypothetical protein